MKLISPHILTRCIITVYNDYIIFDKKYKLIIIIYIGKMV